MTKKLSECPYCRRSADDTGSIFHVGGCTGLQEVPLNRLQYDGLTQEIERLNKKCAALAFLLYGKLGESVPQQQRCVTLLLDYAVVAQEWTCRCDKLGGDLCMRCEVLEAIRSLRPAVATVNDPTTPPTYTVTP